MASVNAGLSLAADCFSSAARLKVSARPDVHLRDSLWSRNGFPRLVQACGSNENTSTNANDAPSAREERRRMRKELVRKAFHLMGEAMVRDKVEYPMWMDDEGDPNWGDDPDDGWGFRMDKFFKKPKVRRQRKEGEESDSELDDVDWDSESKCEWMVREITQEEWYQVIFEDQRPIVLFVYERYGPRWSVCWDALKQLEKAVKTFYDKKRIGLRVAKIDAERDPDLAGTLKLESVPALLIVQNSKLLHRIYGFRTEDDILQLVAHFFHGGRKPDFLQEGIETPEPALELQPRKSRKKNE